MMKNSKEVFSEITKYVIGGTKVPHSVSQPLLYCENSKYFISVFVFFFTKDDIENGTVDRPTIWILADIESGEIIEERQTRDKEFSDAPYNVKYDVRADAQYNTSKKYYDEAFAILDSCRSKIINSGKLYLDEYKYYLDKIVANIPKEYQRFYYDLSI